MPNRSIAFQRANSGVSTPVYRVDISPGRETFFLRLAEAAGEQREAEIHVHRLLAATGLPVPTIAMWEAEPPELDRSAALTTTIPGKPLADCAGLDQSLRRAAAHDAGRDLARMNLVSVRGFGWVQTIAPTDAMLVAEHPTRSTWAAEYAQAEAMVSASGIMPDATINQLRAVLGRWLDRPAQTTSYLAHGDLDATHIYVDESSHAHTGIIDFGEIRGADQSYDLGHALLQDHHPDIPAIFPDLLAGYREVTPLPDDVMADIWEQAIAIGTRQLAIFLGRAAPATPSLASALKSLLAPTGWASPDP